MMLFLRRRGCSRRLRRHVSGLHLARNDGLQGEDGSGGDDDGSMWIGRGSVAAFAVDGDAQGIGVGVVDAGVMPICPAGSSVPTWRATPIAGLGKRVKSHRDHLLAPEMVSRRAGRSA